MKIRILITVSFLFPALFSKATMDCIWRSTSKGIEVVFIASCNQNYKIYIDNFLNRIVSKLNRQDTTTKILILVNTERLSYPDTKLSNFISIGFDTLRLMDDEFISNYYFSKRGDIKQKYLERFEPLDINATLNDTPKQIGIKIIYRRDSRVAETNWNEIEKLVLYSSNNIEFIKKNQTRNYVRYDYNGWSVSLLSIDTFRIKEIIDPSSVIKNKKSITVQSFLKYVLLAIVTFFLVFMLFRLKQENKS